jgi:hypothetical protein
MFKIINAINQEDGKTKELTINTDNIVFLAEADVSTNIKGLDGEPKLKKGTSIMFSNGLVIDTESTINQIICANPVRPEQSKIAKGYNDGKNKQVQTS